MATNMASPIRLPMVDLSDPDTAAAGKALLNAAIEYGFLYIDSRTSKFTERDVERVFKMNKGWVGMHVETLDPENHERGDFKEALNIGELDDGKVQQALPPTLLSQENEISHFTRLCNETCAQILKLLSQGLEIPENFFTSRHDPSKGSTGNSLRLLYYPSDVSSFRPEKDIRAGAHSDYGSITLLFQCPGQPGLEILTPDQTWAPVPVYPGDLVKYPFPPILVNIGDMLSYWTDGLLKSTVHRVVFPREMPESSELGPRDRYSIAFFCQPVGSTELVPVPSKLVENYREAQNKDPNKSFIVGYGGGANSLDSDQPRMTAGEHLQSRLNATYLKSI
ncbi:unnamed protein product [Penicillium pancosmium]